MPALSLNQAAKESKRSKATLLDAIRAGRMSAPKDELGRYQIDPAELFRVYPVTGTEPDTETAADPQPTPLETALLREKTANLERIIAALEDERDDLRRRLDDEAEERRTSAAEIRRLTLLLTDQRQDTAKAPETPQDAPQPFRLPLPPAFLWLALSAAFAAGLVAVWQEWNPLQKP